MQWLNYHHLYYFSVIAEEGGVAPAARKLRLTHSTLSTQLRALEEQFGAPLFERRGKRLVLTAFGADAAAYAADIFRLGRELIDVAKGSSASIRNVLRVGVVPGVPKTLAQRLLRPALNAGVSATLRQDEPERLLSALLAGRLQLVIMNDTPVAPPGAKLHVHSLGETDVLLYATTQLARRARADYPRSLSEVPFVLPAAGAPLRKRLDAWFAKHGVKVSVTAEVDDAGLLRALGAGGHGVFPTRFAVRTEVEDLRGLQEVGKCDGLHEPYFAVTTERRIRHAGIALIVEGARTGLNSARETQPRR